MAKVLIIDDDLLVCQSLELVAKRKDHEAFSVHTLHDGLVEAQQGNYDLVFLDVRMPDGNGLDLLPSLEEVASSPEIIIITGYGDPDGAELALRSGVWDYLEKGATAREITLSLVRALQYRQQKMNREDFSEPCIKREGIVGSSPPLMQCLKEIAKAAVTDAPILITGETGTGKELFARAVHQNSKRAGRGFVVVDCAALPEHLVESTLFGHEKGSFTGADQPREGLIRQADGGTLFLDEVGELPLSLQKAFLRVLQERRFRPVGSGREVASNFRLVAATNRDIDRMVQEEAFRADLLFRLRSFQIELPNLRHRPDDIKELVRFHADRICKGYGLKPKVFSPEYLNMFSLYTWPGNVRELVNTVERSIAAARHDAVLFPTHLPLALRILIRKKSLNGPISPDADSGHRKMTFPPLHEYRESICQEAEHRYLVDLMAAVDNRVAEACRISKVSPSRLYALLKREGISPHQ